MQRSSWGEVEASPKRKARYAEPKELNDKLTKSQVEGILTWNEMIEVLRENGLMEEQ